MRTHSLRTKIVLAFLACIGLSVLAFGILLAVGVQFRTAQAVSRSAVDANRTAVQAGQRAGDANAALYRYINSADVGDRQALDAQLSPLAPMVPGGDALLGNAKTASGLIEKSQGAGVALLDSSSSLAQSILTLGELSAALADPSVGTLNARINQAFGLAATNIGRLVALRSDRFGDVIKDDLQRMVGPLKDMQALPTATARIKKTAGVVSRDMQTLTAQIDAYRKLVADRTAALGTLKASFASVSTELQQRLDASNASFVTASASADRASDTMLTSLMIAAPAVLAIGITLALLVGRSIAGPIAALTATMGTLAAGRYDVIVTSHGRKDEIGAMARAVEVFKANGLSLIDKEREAQESRSLSEGERARNEAARTQSAREQSFVVSSIGSGLSALSQGDLTCRLNAAFPADYRKLQDDFNAAMERLQATVLTIVTASDGIGSGTGEITQAAEDLSRRTEQQAASLEETAAALNEITATVHKTAEGANRARDAVIGTKSDAERSGKIVRDAVSAMSEIERSSGKITQIIGVIDEIAFQTNLLALNAGVEAARAGEAGRGFAVVASEVRALAQRSAEAAKEIKALIQASTRQVATGVDLVGQTGEALARIVEQVSGINAVVAEIATSARDQSTGLVEVNTAITQMDQVTQQNAAMVEETTAASHALSREAQELGRLVAHFEVGGGTARPKAPAAQAARPVAALKAVGGRGSSALRKPALAAAQDDWEEF